jgi:hypothetical protein
MFPEMIPTPSAGYPRGPLPAVGARAPALVGGGSGGGARARVGWSDRPISLAARALLAQACRARRGRSDERCSTAGTLGAGPSARADVLRATGGAPRGVAAAVLAWLGAWRGAEGAGPADVELGEGFPEESRRAGAARFVGLGSWGGAQAAAAAGVAPGGRVAYRAVQPGATGPGEGAERGEKGGSETGGPGDEGRGGRGEVPRGVGGGGAGVIGGQPFPIRGVQL